MLRGRGMSNADAVLNIYQKREIRWTRVTRPGVRNRARCQTEPGIGNAGSTGGNMDTAIFVAIITAVGGIVAAWIGVWGKARESKKDSASRVAAPSTLERQEGLPKEAVAMNAPQQLSPEPLGTVSHQRIFIDKGIEDSPRRLPGVLGPIQQAVGREQLPSMPPPAITVKPENLVESATPPRVAPTPPAGLGEFSTKISLAPNSPVRQKLKSYLVGATYGGPFDCRSEVFASIKMEMGNNRQMAFLCLEALIGEHPIELGKSIDKSAANACLMSIRVHPSPSQDMIRYALAVMQLADDYCVRATLATDIGDLYVRVSKTWPGELRSAVYGAVSEATSDDMHQYVRKYATDALRKMTELPG